ncbi:MAG: nicotinamide mononucleotide transporter PnuC, partial [Erysipelotrichaceae bacterium]|nr:nicotinamide mononucleotide transporter PnuC [Erysipelotrichaceae bacterium]
MKKLFKYAEPNRKLRIAEYIVLLLILVGIIISLGYGFIRLNSDVGNITPIGAVEMIRDESEEDYDEDYTVCDVIYVNGEDSLTISY